MSETDPGNIVLTYISSLNPQTEITFDELQHFLYNRVIFGILTGTKIGAAGLVLVILWMISKNRKTPIFIINQITLLLVVVHSIVYIKNLLGRFSSLTFHFTLYPEYITEFDKRVYAAANMLQVLIVACIETSLIFQVRVIFRTDNYKRIGTIFTIISALLGVGTVVLYFITAVDGILNVFDDVLKVSDTRFYNIATILLATSVNFMTLLLSVKLFLAIRSRRFLGLRQFDSFHILLIMSAQTLIGPSILFILAYSLRSRGTDSLTTIAMLLVSLSLPLSSMWATSTNNSSQPTSINTQFAPYSDAASFRTANASYYEQSLKSKSWRPNKLHEFYPSKRTGTSSDSGEDNNTIVDVEKNAFQLENINHHSYTIQENVIHFEREKNCSAAISINDDEEKVQTPTTAADEEARAFWSGVSLKGSTSQNQDDGHIQFSPHIQ